MSKIIAFDMRYMYFEILVSEISRIDCIYNQVLISQSSFETTDILK